MVAGDGNGIVASAWWSAILLLYYDCTLLYTTILGACTLDAEHRSCLAQRRAALRCARGAAAAALLV